MPVDDIAGQLQAAIESGDLDAYGALLADDVRWGGEQDTPDACHSRADVLRRLHRMRFAGMQFSVLEVAPAENAILVGLQVNQPAPDGSHQHGVPGDDSP